MLKKIKINMEENNMSKKNKYLLVNLDTCFTNGTEEKTIQPKWLNKYFNHILVSPYNFDKTMDKLLTIGFKRGVGGNRF